MYHSIVLAVTPMKMGLENEVDVFGVQFDTGQSPLQDIASSIVMVGSGLMRYLAIVFTPSF